MLYIESNDEKWIWKHAANSFTLGSLKYKYNLNYNEPLAEGINQSGMLL